MLNRAKNQRCTVVRHHQQLFRSHTALSRLFYFPLGRNMKYGGYVEQIGVMQRLYLIASRAAGQGHGLKQDRFGDENTSPQQKGSHRGVYTIPGTPTHVSADISSPVDGFPRSKEPGRTPRDTGVALAALPVQCIDTPDPVGSAKAAPRLQEKRAKPMAKPAEPIRILPKQRKPGVFITG